MLQQRVALTPSENSPHVGKDALHSLKLDVSLSPVHPLVVWALGSEGQAQADQLVHSPLSDVAVVLGSDTQPSPLLLAENMVLRNEG